MAHMAAIHAAVAADAIKAIGSIVELTPESFVNLLALIEDPLIVAKYPSGVFDNKYQFLVGHKGLVFYTKSREKIPLPPQATIIEARRIGLPTL
jgi:hypothetical protein